MADNKTLTPSVVEGQIATTLPPATVTYTSHDEKTKKAIIHRITAAENVLTKWHDISPANDAAMFTLYTTGATPIDVESDLDRHTKILTENGGHAPLNIENGTIARMVDYAPGFSCPDHRTHTIDVGVVIDGTVELILDSGDIRTIGPGGMIVQRGTMHRWRNPSTDKWARVFYISLSSKARVVGGTELPIDLGMLANLQ